MALGDVTCRCCGDVIASIDALDTHGLCGVCWVYCPRHEARGYERVFSELLTRTIHLNALYLEHGGLNALTEMDLFREYRGNMASVRRARIEAIQLDREFTRLCERDL